MIASIVRPRFNAIFSTALAYALCSKSCTVSSENVENVVKAPSTPIVSARRISSDSVRRLAKATVKKPRIKEPNTLTNKVPYGKSLPSIRTIPRPERYRKPAPIAPPHIIKSNFMAILAPLIQRLLWPLLYQAFPGIHLPRLNHEQYHHQPKNAFCRLNMS